MLPIEMVGAVASARDVLALVGTMPLTVATTGTAELPPDGADTICV